MLQLSRHIEALLLDNDCVVIPGFGGFIAHNTSAVWDNAEKRFLPPSRTIGFNSQLKLNDGLLGQSYMQFLGISYPEATAMLEQEVKKLNDTLHREGIVELPRIGTIRCSASNIYTFEPYGDAVVSPYYYGLDSFEIKELEALLHEDAKAIRKPRRLITPVFGRIVRNVAVVAIAFIILLYNSDPIENTFVEDENYAHILPAELFDKIRKESLITTPVKSSVTHKQIEVKPAVPDSINQDTVKLRTAKDVKVPKAEKKETTEDKKVANKEEYKYHLIIASVAKEDDGKVMVENLHTKGFKDARVISGDGRIRVSIASYTTREEATRELFQLREIKAYQNAWLLTK